MAGKMRRAERVTAKTARRITGISTPFGGLSWSDPGPSEAEVVRKFLLFMEDRRALYIPLDYEVLQHVRASIDQIRAECTKTLQQLGPKAFATPPIRAIRQAARGFQDDQARAFRFFDHGPQGHEGGPAFYTALGVLRAIVGQQVALLAAHYDIDVEGDLAAVLPRLDNERS
jgi:hypothetical protein